MIIYPSGIDSFTTKVDDVDEVMAADVNLLQTAIVAIETALGTGTTNFVSKSGDTMTGSLNMGADLVMLGYDITSTSGLVISDANNNSIIMSDGGVALNDSVYSNNIQMNVYGVSVSDNVNSNYISMTDAGLKLESTVSINAQGSVIPVASGTYDLGSTGLSWGTLYVDNIVSTGIAGQFVNVSGDTMTGDLNLASGVVITTDEAFQVTAFNTNTIVMGTGIYDGIQLNNNLDNNLIYLNSFGITLSENVGSSYLYVRNSDVDVEAIDLNLNLTGSVLPTVSGINNLGSLAVPFSGVYALSVNDRVVIVSKVNEVPTGNISSGTNTIFTLSQPPYGTSLSLFKNGLLTTPSGLYAGVGDYVLSGSTINLVSAPASGSVLLASYGYEV